MSLFWNSFHELVQQVMRNGRIDVPVRMRMRIIERSSCGNLCSLKKKTIETRVQFRQVTNQELRLVWDLVYNLHLRGCSRWGRLGDFSTWRPWPGCRRACYRPRNAPNRPCTAAAGFLRPWGKTWTWRETRRTGRASSGRWRWGRRRNEVQSSSSRHRRWRPCVSPVPPDLVASFPSRGHRGRRWLSWTPGPWKCLWSWTPKASVESLL